MSIRVMNRVWENSSACGGELLVLLALADHADDRGFAWPGIDSLAKKSRLTARHVTRCLNNLAAADELRIQHNRGPRGTNRYQVLCFRAGDNAAALPARCQDDKPCRGDTRLPQMSSEPPEPSESPAQTVGAGVGTEDFSEWPAEDQVLQHAQTYLGNTAIGIPAKAITEDWARDYWAWRTFDEERWPKRWREEMVRRFEREWRDGGRAARSLEKRSAAAAAMVRKVSGGSPPPPMSSGPVDLNKMRVAAAESATESHPKEEGLR